MGRTKVIHHEKYHKLNPGQADDPKFNAIVMYSCACVPQNVAAAKYDAQHVQTLADGSVVARQGQKAKKGVQLPDHPFYEQLHQRALDSFLHSRDTRSSTATPMALKMIVLGE